VKEILDNFGGLLMGNKETVAVAESVTSGTTQTMLSLATNASIFFQGGITTYTLDSKVKLSQEDYTEQLLRIFERQLMQDLDYASNTIQ